MKFVDLILDERMNNSDSIRSFVGHLGFTHFIPHFSEFTSPETPLGQITSNKSIREILGTALLKHS